MYFTHSRFAWPPRLTTPCIWDGRPPSDAPYVFFLLTGRLFNRLRGCTLQCVYIIRGLVGCLFKLLTGHLSKPSIGCVGDDAARECRGGAVCGLRDGPRPQAAPVHRRRDRGTRKAWFF